jgi:hypothetical protein
MCTPVRIQLTLQSLIPVCGGPLGSLHTVLLLTIRSFTELQVAFPRIRLPHRARHRHSRRTPKLHTVLLNSVLRSHSRSLHPLSVLWIPYITSCISSGSSVAIHRSRQTHRHYRCRRRRCESCIPYRRLHNLVALPEDLLDLLQTLLQQQSTKAHDLTVKDPAAHPCQVRRCVYTRSVLHL